MSYSVYIKDGSTLVPLPSGGGGGVSVTTETTTISDGATSAFSVPAHSGALLLIYNGLFLHEGVDYTDGSTSVTLAFVPEAGDVITAVAFN